MSLSGLFAAAFANRRQEMASLAGPAEPMPAVCCANLGCGKVANMSACAKCKLVKYCSKPCQVAHWPKHKEDCNHPYSKANWQPGWVQDQHTPAFLRSTTQNVLFGMEGQYLWGNVPAIDCLQLATSEGPSASERDFNFCFAAAGDIRHLVSTVNGLPEDYRGTCRVLVNDKNPIITCRNIFILNTLLAPDRPIESAAETALHLWYSAALRPSDAAEVYRCAQVLASCIQQPVNGCALRGESRMVLSNLPSTPLPAPYLLSKYDLDAAMVSMRDVMLAPSRVDYRDRHLARLQPGHRVSWAKSRMTGILAPFTADLTGFTQPNRLMFTPDGDWMMRDNANALQGWPVQAVLESGKRHNLDPTDIYGCLFVHVRDQLACFARRVEQCRIEIHVTGIEMQDLAALIQQGDFAPAFTAGCFDRVETSNVADYIGLKNVLSNWGPLLRRENKHAAIFAYSMNWHATFENPMKHLTDASGRRKRLNKAADMLGINVKTMPSSELSTHSPQLLALDFFSNVFEETSQDFETWLGAQEATQTAKQLGLRLRPRHRIHPKRFGVPLSAGPRTVPDMTRTDFYNTYVVGAADAPVRFVEFEVA